MNGGGKVRSGIVMGMKTRLSTPEPRALVEASDADSLIQGELEAAAFPDERLGKRLGVMLDQFADGTAESVPLACQDWANTKAAYRFFANDHVTEADILGEPDRCVHIGDRESDIYELFCAAEDAGTHFLIRSCANRRAEDGTIRLEAEMAEVRVQSTHRIEVRDRLGHPTEAILELRYRRVRLLPPVAKQKQYQPVEVTAIYAQERGTPKNRDRIDWKLLTDLPVGTPDAALEKLRWYALRWKIEVFHKILKSGCRVEASGLRTAERLVRLVAVCCIFSWRVFWMTMINRTQPQAAPTIALTQLELDLLDHLFPERGKAKAVPALGAYLVRIARLGGYLARAGDPVPGNIVMWRGLARLTDLTLGFDLGRRFVGN